jgi:hypothetical protein
MYNKYSRLTEIHRQQLGDLHYFVEAAGPVDFPYSAEAVELVDSQCFVEAAGLVGLVVVVECWHLELVEQNWFLQPPQ